MKASVTINGAQVALYFSVEAALYIMQQPEIENMKEGDQVSFTQAAIIAYGGYKGECMANREMETLKFRDFYEYVNDSTKNGPAELATAIEAYMQSLSFCLQKKEQENGEEKKRLSRKK